MTWEEIERYVAVENKDPVVQKIFEILDKHLEEEIHERVIEERDPDFEDMQHMWIMAGINLSAGIDEFGKELLADIRTISYENLEDHMKLLLKKFRSEHDPYSD